ncbi:hypothetical protein DPX16_21740 [Anabarilius grahami]|uniref:Uncharacterized protein n=1 Tax=Anabarilius grahami TaxID=495550 RepID=A0A3N0YJZ1_ANAGA|nr:hypothetical protein DPX16_21740 [Anabarilius grahami]
MVAKPVSLYSAWYGRPVVSLKYREDMNYITVDGCSSQEKEEVEKSRKRQTQRDFNWHVGAGRLAKHLGTLKGSWMAGRRGADDTQRHSQQMRRTLGILEDAGDSAADEEGDECQVCVVSILVRECVVIG